MRRYLLLEVPEAKAEAEDTFEDAPNKVQPM